MIRAKRFWAGVLGSLIAVTGMVLAATPVFAGSAQDDILNGVQTVDPGGSQSIDSTIGSVIGILSTVIGIIAVVMMLLGSYKYVTSAGDAGKVSSAKSTILYALIGVALVVLTQVILRFVIAKASNP